MKPPPFPGLPADPAALDLRGLPRFLASGVKAREGPFLWLGGGQLHCAGMLGLFAIPTVAIGAGVALEPDGIPALGAAVAAGGVLLGVGAVVAWLRDAPCECVLDVERKVVWELTRERRPRPVRPFRCDQLYLHVAHAVATSLPDDPTTIRYVKLDVAGPERPVDAEGHRRDVTFRATLAMEYVDREDLRSVARAVGELQGLTPWAGLTAGEPGFVNRLLHLQARDAGPWTSWPCPECGEPPRPGLEVATCAACRATYHETCRQRMPAACSRLGCQRTNLIVHPWGEPGPWQAQLGD